ncbi:MAG: ABC transporter ATP-binding protein [Acidobacteriota bacterium]
MEPAIVTTQLTRAFGEHLAVDRLDLEVEAGLFFGFLGPNGAGKSTTIKMLTGLLDPSSGSASILGHDVVRDHVEAKRCIGVVPEDLALFDRLTAPEYLTFVGRMYGLAPADIGSRSDELLEWMDLHEQGRKLIVDYSHGMKKKLALAAALIHRPRVLFLDEPFEGIDAVASRQVRDLLGSLQQGGVTIFLTSHILEIVERLCSHVAVIDGGRLVAQGSLDELRRGIASDDAGEQAAGRPLEELFLSLVGKDDTPKSSLSWLQ